MPSLDHDEIKAELARVDYCQNDVIEYLEENPDLYDIDKYPECVADKVINGLNQIYHSCDRDIKERYSFIKDQTVSAEIYDDYNLLSRAIEEEAEIILNLSLKLFNKIKDKNMSLDDYRINSSIKINFELEDNA